MLRKILLPTIFALLAYSFWVSPNFKDIAAGVAIFLFGMLSLEEGFRAFTGGALEKILKKTTNTLWKSVGFGVVTTTLMQSSSLVAVITISFLSAGLLGLAEGIGIIFGANLGTTTGAWLVAGFGLKVDIAAYAMPMLVFGVVLIFQGKKALKGCGYVLCGMGFLFLGIHYMKEGFEAFKHTVDLSQFAVTGYKGVALFSVVGIVATVLMQSSHATLVLIITALAAGQITYENALALAIGANVGTTVTAILGSLSSNVAGKRLAAAHVIFNAVTALIAVAFIYQLAQLVDWVSAHVGIGDTDYTLKLAVFHTTFNLLGIAVMLPFTGRLVNLLFRIFRKEPDKRAEPKYLTRAAVDFPDTAVEAVRNETLRVYKHVLRILCKTLGISRKDLVSNRDLEELLARAPKVENYPIDEAYNNEVKAIFSAIIAFISRATSTWQSAQSGKLHWLRNAGRHLVEAVKGVKHLQKNLVHYTHSANPHQNAEYQYIRLSIAKVLRELERIRHTTEEEEVVVIALERLKLSVADMDNKLLDRIYVLINEDKITADMGTSLINDYGYACQLSSDMLNAAATLFLDAHSKAHEEQNNLALDSEEATQVLPQAKDDNAL